MSNPFAGELSEEQHISLGAPTTFCVVCGAPVINPRKLCPPCLSEARSRRSKLHAHGNKTSTVALDNAFGSHRPGAVSSIKSAPAALGLILRDFG